ncbi:Crp/Fnr family transcriptional regulator [Isoptericola sp. b441]|uniref:Crp/Fnr family transcriptional regulator n=1 Tax=Actinotalea lenta TaxID=3064654 RepID=A0ABT9DD15_9CELL|nr:MULTISPECIES: Crp/Fnr family transcriptional regulator [unclassified Isoptericola]MDO8107128.1 Crp/Fnr family transcriptional regulator [Isoptericola sp. b441]MDO8121155.1 Crp/Fnr family transcriptional regulator [Isoptericola sp. b490]
MCVSRVPVFAALAPSDQLSIAGLARATRLPEGAVAYSPADPEPKLVVVHTGHLRVSRLSADGAEHLMRVLSPGDFAGEAAVFSADPPTDTGRAMDDCHVCVFHHDDLATFVGDHPDLALRMLAAVTTRLKQTEDRLHALVSRGVEARVAHYLLGLPGRWRGAVVTVSLPLSKRDVASVLDTTPESLSRALRHLSQAGAITVGHGRSVTIDQPDVLQQVADGE